VTGWERFPNYLKKAPDKICSSVKAKSFDVWVDMSDGHLELGDELSNLERCMGSNT
jgi:hypothetical protein